MPHTRALDLGDLDVEVLFAENDGNPVALETLPMYNAETAASLWDPDGGVILCSCCCC